MFGDIKMYYDEESNQNIILWDKQQGSKTCTGESKPHQHSFNLKTSS